MAANRAQVLIVGMPGPMRDCLLTLLKAIPDLDLLESENGDWPPTVLSPGKLPDLVLMDFGCPAAEMTRDVVWIKANWSSPRCLVLADTSRQLQAARAAGADGVLLRGFAAAEFFTTLRALLTGKDLLGLEMVMPRAAVTPNSLKNGANPGEDQALLVSPLVF